MRVLIVFVAKFKPDSDNPIFFDDSIIQCLISVAFLSLTFSSISKINCVASYPFFCTDIKSIFVILELSKNDSAV